MKRCSQLSLLAATVLACATAPKPRPVSNEPPERVALLDLKPPDENSVELAHTLGAIVAFDLEETGRFKVISRDDLAGMLRARQQQELLGCETAACQSDIANAVDVKRIVTGSLGKLGAKYVVSLSLIDTGKAETLRRTMETVPAKEEALMEAAERSAATLASREPPQPGARPSGGGHSAGSALAAGLQQSAAIMLGRAVDNVKAVGSATPLEPLITAALETSLAQGLRQRLDEMKRARAAGAPPAAPARP